MRYGLFWLSETDQITPPEAGTASCFAGEVGAHARVAWALAARRARKPTARPTAIAKPTALTNLRPAPPGAKCRPFASTTNSADGMLSDRLLAAGWARSRSAAGKPRFTSPPPARNTQAFRSVPSVFLARSVKSSDGLKGDASQRMRSRLLRPLGPPGGPRRGPTGAVQLVDSPTAVTSHPRRRSAC